MNYAHFSEWIQERVEDLVSFGVPRAEACEIIKSLEFAAIRCEADARSERQFLLDFKAVGAAVMAKRLGVTPSAVWLRRRKLLRKAKPLAALAP